jgi:GABA permease
LLDSTRESLLLSVGLAAVVVAIGVIRYRRQLSPVGPHLHTEVEDRAEALEEDAEAHGHGA